MKTILSLATKVVAKTKKKTKERKCKKIKIYTEKDIIYLSIILKNDGGDVKI